MKREIDLKDPNFQSSWRKKSRNNIYRDVMKLLKNHGEAEPQDKVFALNLVKHKVIEQFEKENRE